MKKTLLIPFILISIASFSQSWWNSKKVRGNGNITTITRTIDNFNEISLSGFFNVVLVEGNVGKITLKGEENILPYIVTEVNNGHLKIKVKNNANLKTNRELTITVPFKNIKSASLGGSGNIIIEKTIKSESIAFSIGGSGNIKANVNVENVKSSIGGSGNMKISGTTNRFKCSIAGSGNIDAYALASKDLKVSLTGSGNIKTSVSSKIKASVVGSGSIYYKGDPELVDIKSLGSGSVIKRD